VEEARGDNELVELHLLGASRDARTFTLGGMDNTEICEHENMYNQEGIWT
jgi:hypothetical protein